jgi:hypothetical protein
MKQLQQLSDVHRVGFHCHADELHPITKHVFGPLKQHWGEADSTIIRKWKWLFVNGCERKSVLSILCLSFRAS